MKVIRVTTSLNFGGVERNFELHAKYHRKADYELVMVALAGGGRAESFIRSCGVRVILLNANPRIPSVATLWKLFRLLRAEKPDVVHGACAEGIFFGLVAGWLAGVPTRIGEEIGIPSHSRMARMLFSLVYLTAYKVYGISLAVSSYLKMYEVASAKVETIYYPIDVDAAIPPKVRKSPPIVFATVCRLEEVKNLPSLLHLFSAIRQRRPGEEFELWLIGDGSQRPVLEKLAGELGLTPFVRFFGYLEKPLEVLVNADLFILPSLKEGFGLACIEAIQCGLPVVVTRSGGMTEYITDGVNGFLFDPTSLEEMIQKTELVLEMPEQYRKELASRGLRLILDLFHPDRYLNSLNCLYRRKELPPLPV